MGTDVALRVETPVTVRLSADQLKYIAHSEFVPKSMRGKLPAILACVAMGRELGLGDMVALNTIHVIEGRTSLSAEAMVGLVRKRGHSIQGNFSADSCTVTGRRADNGDEMTVTWTKQMAEDAGLAGKDNWRKYTPAMLWARGVSQLCRMLFADCFAGATYTPDEVSDADFDGEALSLEGEPMAEEPMNGSAFPTGDTVPQDDGDPASPSEAQLKKLNVLVGTLREAGHVNNEQLWRAMNREPVASADGELHWSPLRDSLSKQEASLLIERLSRLEERVGAAA